MSNAFFDANRPGRIEQVEAFVESVAEQVERGEFRSNIDAIEARVGMHLSLPLLKLGLLAHWLHLDPHALEEACRERPLLSRFVSASSTSTIVDIWVYQQIAPRMRSADIEFAQFADALEDALAVQGQRLTISGDAATASLPDPDPARTAIVDPTHLTPWDAPFDGEAATRTPDMPEPVPRKAADQRAIAVWPWGEVTEIDAAVPVGRDPEFSPFAHRIGRDRWVSRRHLLLAPMAGGVMLRDVGSSNGSMIDNVRIGRGQARLIDGDCVVQLGLHLRFKIVFYPTFGAQS